MQVSVAPYDVRQGNFIGAGVNTVTRSGTNQFTGSVYHRMRNENYVGTEAAGLTSIRAIFNDHHDRRVVRRPDHQEQDVRLRQLREAERHPSVEHVPGRTAAARRWPATPPGCWPRRCRRSASFLSRNFNYKTGPFDDIPKDTPGKPWMIKGDYNVNSANKVTFRYNQLDSSTLT